MAEKNIKADVFDEGDLEIYELGYHLLPSVPEEDLTKEVGQIKDLISSFEGNLIAEGNPTMRQLAYDIAKKIETKNLRFNKAYFGWVKFEMDRSAVIEFKTKVASLASILRLIIVKTVKENTMSVAKIPSFKKEVAKDTPADLEVVEKAPASEAEIDKSIDDLVVEGNL